MASLSCAPFHTVCEMVGATRYCLNQTGTGWFLQLICKGAIPAGFWGQGWVTPGS